MRVKEACANYVSCLLKQHIHVMKTAPFLTSIDYKEVEEAVLDSDTHIELLDSLFAMGGHQSFSCFTVKWTYPHWVRRINCLSFRS
jgi:hypothetical protein